MGSGDSKLEPTLTGEVVSEREPPRRRIETSNSEKPVRTSDPEPQNPNDPTLSGDIYIPPSDPEKERIPPKELYIPDTPIKPIEKPIEIKGKNKSKGSSLRGGEGTIFGTRQGKVMSLEDYAEIDVKQEIEVDYKGLIEQHKNELTHQQKFNDGKIDTHHLFYHPVIDKELALLYIRECHLVYTPIEQRAEEVGVEYIEDDANRYKIRVRVSKLGNDRTIVSFRGTKNYKNLQADLYTRGYEESKLSDYFKFITDKDDLKVHTGFLQVVADLYEDLSNIIGDRKNVEYTGHSLGSVVSIYAYVRFIETGELPKHLYTFGSPRMFINDENYPISRFNDRIDYIRFFNAFDGISYLPSKTSKTTLATIGAGLGGGLGYGLGSMFHKRVADRISKTGNVLGAGIGSTLGGLAGRQLGNYLHIGTGVLLYDEKGAKFNKEYSLHDKHSGGVLPSNESYVVIPKGLDLYRNAIDFNGYLSNAVFNFTKSFVLPQFFSKFNEYYKNKGERERLRDKARVVEEVKSAIENFSNEEFSKDLRKVIGRRVVVGGLTPVLREPGEINSIRFKLLDREAKNLKQSIVNKIVELFRERYLRLNPNVLEIPKRGEWTREQLIKEYLIGDGLTNIDDTIIARLADDPYIDPEYLTIFNKGSSIRKTWIKIRTRIITGSYKESEGKTFNYGDYIAHVGQLVGLGYALYYSINKFYGDGYEVLKFGLYHKLQYYDETISLLPEYIGEEKNNGHTIKANVFRNEEKYDTDESTDEVQEEGETSRTSEDSQGGEEGKREEKSTSRAPFRTSEPTKASSAQSISKEVVQAFGEKEGQVRAIEEIDEMIRKDDDDDDLGIYEALSDNLANIPTVRSSYRTPVNVPPHKHTPHRHTPHSHNSLEKLKEDIYAKQKSRTSEDIKERITQRTNPEFNLRHVKNGIYIDEATKNTYRSVIKGNDITFRNTAIKILGYYFYKKDEDIKNKIVVF